MVQIGSEKRSHKTLSTMQPFANVLQNRSSYKFLDIHKKISVLESLFNKVARLIACNFIKKETPTPVLCCEYHKMYEKNFFYGTPLKMVEEFPRISKGSLTQNNLYDSTNLNV